MITDPNIYFQDGCGRCAQFQTDACTARRWSDGLLELRRLCRAVGLIETAKWGHPCYMAHGRNIAIIGGFRDTFRLTFFHAGLLKDSSNVLVAQGPNTATAGVMKFNDATMVRQMAPIIETYLTEAIGYAAQGLSAPHKATDKAMPDELIAAMDEDPLFADAFHALTPGRQRGWILHFSGAKQSATRSNRITKATPKILTGKGWNER